RRDGPRLGRRNGAEHGGTDRDRLLCDRDGDSIDGHITRGGRDHLLRGRLRWSGRAVCLHLGIWRRSIGYRSDGDLRISHCGNLHSDGDRHGCLGSLPDEDAHRRGRPKSTADHLAIRRIAGLHELRGRGNRRGRGRSHRRPVRPPTEAAEDVGSTATTARTPSPHRAGYISAARTPRRKVSSPRPASMTYASSAGSWTNRTSRAFASRRIMSFQGCSFVRRSLPATSSMSTTRSVDRLMSFRASRTSSTISFAQPSAINSFVIRVSRKTTPPPHLSSTTCSGTDSPKAT